MNPMNPGAPIDVQSIMADPEKMGQLAYQFDPAPILKELGGSVDGQGNFTPQFPVAGENSPYSQMLSQATQNMTQPGAGAPPGAAPLDPRSLGMINSMMPQPPKAQFMGAPGAAPKAQVKIDIPDLGAAIGRGKGGIPSLAQFMGGK